MKSDATPPSTPQAAQPDHTPVLKLAELAPAAPPAVPVVKEIGGRQNGMDPTRYGDWEKDGRCIDF